METRKINWELDHDYIVDISNDIAVIDLDIAIATEKLERLVDVVDIDEDDRDYIRSEIMRHLDDLHENLNDLENILYMN